MADSPLERRGSTDVLSDLRVSVGKIETAVGYQTESLQRIDRRLEVAVLRDEFNARNTAVDLHLRQLDGAMKNLEDAHQRQVGSSSAWRLIFASALAVLSVVIAAAGIYYVPGLHHP